MEDSCQSLPEDAPIIYCRRWVVVFALWCLNISSGMLCTGYASMANYTVNLYDVSVTSVNNLFLVFPLFTIILGFPCIFILERLSLRFTLYICAFLNLTSATIRILLAYDSTSTSFNYSIALVGQCLAALAQPLIIFPTSKVASVWFPPSQRVIANTVAFLGNPLGLLFGFFLPTLSSLKGFPTTLFGVTLAAALFTVLGICHSTPPQLHTINSNNSSLSYSFYNELKLCVCNRNFLILVFTFGFGLGTFFTLTTLMEQFLCPYGYSMKFARNSRVFLIVFGLVGAVFFGVVSNRIKALLEIFRLCFILSTFGMILFSVLTSLSVSEYYIIVSLCWFGFFGMAIFSISLELAAELSFPVSENISAGILVISGQIFTMLFILLSCALSKPISLIIVPLKCIPSSESKLWILNIVMYTCTVLGSVLTLHTLSVSYKRRSMEEELTVSRNLYGSDTLCE